MSEEIIIEPLIINPKEEKATHKKLVGIAYKWVLSNSSCGVAFKELVCASSPEIPDVIGFGSWGHSVLVEVKVSRSDFLSDKNKKFKKPYYGHGISAILLLPYQPY